MLIAIDVIGEIVWHRLPSKVMRASAILAVQVSFEENSWKSLADIHQAFLLRNVEVLDSV